MSEVYLGADAAAGVDAEPSAPDAATARRDGGPAFPREDYQANGYPRNTGTFGQEGMSMRDYFAAKAMQGMYIAGTGESYEQRAFDAYQQADAMLKAREQ